MSNKKSSNPKHDQSSSIPTYGDDELVRLSDFQSTKIRFTIQNTTTNTVVNESDDIQMVELLTKGVVLQLPRRSCARGHHLMVAMTATVPGDGVHRFSFTAKVEEVESLEDDRNDKISLTFVQYEEAEWTAMCRVFENRQADILNFLKAARGY